jgi:hypothetical protein
LKRSQDRKVGKGTSISGGPEGLSEGEVRGLDLVERLFRVIEEVKGGVEEEEI